MAKEVILTPLAITNYEQIVDYLISEWNPTVTNNFIKRFEGICNLLSKNPELFPFLNKEKLVQKCVVTKHNTIYFKETANSIIVLAIFDSRQDPDKLLALF